MCRNRILYLWPHAYILDMVAKMLQIDGFENLRINLETRHAYNVGSHVFDFEIYYMRLFYI